MFRQQPDATEKAGERQEPKGRRWYRGRVLGRPTERKNAVDSGLYGVASRSEKSFEDAAMAERQWNVVAPAQPKPSAPCCPKYAGASERRQRPQPRSQPWHETKSSYR